MMTVYGYARLVGYGPNIELKPDILEAFDVVDDREFTLQLRKGHKWSDGQPFTAEDFRYFWEDMVNDPELSRGGVPPEMLVDGEAPKFEIIDDLTVRFSWDKPNPAFLPALAAPSPVYIFRPAHYLKQFHAKYADKDKLEAMVKEAKYKSWAQLHIRQQRQRRPRKSGPADARSVDATPRRRPPSSSSFVRNPYFHRVDPEGSSFPISTRS